jgi:type IX secretion system PorP/SprF family membrane protein
MYTQYTFNKAGMNPASAGTDINQKYYYAFGMNRQWVEFDNAPKTNFVNFSYTIRPPRSYRRWQNVGGYVDVEDSGLMTNSGVYAGYTLHTLLNKSTVLSVGVYAGVRRYSRSVSQFDNNDPAVAKNKSDLILYPDIIPGVRLATKKYFAGLSLRQITINKLQDFKGRKMGSPSKLDPTIYAEYGRMIELSQTLLMMPSVAANIPIIAPPVIDAALMFYFANRVGAGVGVRNASFANAILQIRLFESLTVGLAYSYPINNVRYGARNSYEIMVGIVPIGMNTKLVGRHSIAKCPTLAY